MADFVQNGDSVDYTPGSDVDAGAVVVVGDRVGVVKTKIEANTLGARHMKGVFKFPKATGGGSAIADGKEVYWDESGEVMTETSTDNTAAGPTVGAAGDDDEWVFVNLNA